MEELRTNFPTVVLGKNNAYYIFIDKDEYELEEVKGMYILHKK